MAAENQRHEMSAVEIQQEYYETIGDADWELYEKKNRGYLLQKVAVALCGPPTKEGNLKECVENVGDKLKLQGYGARDEETCMNVSNKILEQAKYSHNGENLIISVLRVVCVIPSREIKFFERTPKDYWVNLQWKKGKSVHILVFHVFSIRKCISMNSEVKGCKIFIDHDARIYETWTDFMSHNNLPKCVMVVPENGEYSGHIIEGSEIPKVKLTVAPSPELGIGTVVLNAVDRASTAANIGALVTVVGSLFASPVAAPVMVSVAVGVASVSGAYGIGRSIANLVDRGQHKQSIGLKNTEARSSWINIIVSTVGLSFTAAGKLLTWAATSGRNVKILMNALEFLKYTNLATGFFGVANGLGEMIYKFAKYGEKPTSIEVFQFTTSVLFLGLGAMSNQTAQEIVTDAQAGKINEIRDSLSGNKKKLIFDKVAAETRRVKGIIEGNTDVIRALKKINNKDEFFGKLRTINKSVNKNKVRISLAPDGKLLVNNQHKLSVSSVHRIGSEARNKLFAKYGPAKVTTKNAPTRIFPSYAMAGTSNVPLKDFAYTIRPEEVFKISTFLIHLTKADQDILLEILSCMSEQLHDLFLLLCTELIHSFIPAELDFIKSFLPDWKIKSILFAINYLKSKITIDENDNTLMVALKEFIRDGRINKDSLLKLKHMLMDYFKALKNDNTFNNKSWIEGDDYMSRYFVSLNTLRAGQCLTIGPHKVLVKQITVDNFETWFENYSPEKYDVFIGLCYKIISFLTKDDVCRLNAINPDEDLIMRVSYFLLDKFEEYFAISPIVDPKKALVLKQDILQWCSRQSLRPRVTCKKCRGIQYC